MFIQFTPMNQGFNQGFNQASLFQQSAIQPQQNSFSLWAPQTQAPQYSFQGFGIFTPIQSYFGQSIQQPQQTHQTQQVNNSSYYNLGMSMHNLGYQLMQGAQQLMGGVKSFAQEHPVMTSVGIGMGSLAMGMGVCPYGGATMGAAGLMAQQQLANNPH